VVSLLRSEMLEEAIEVMRLLWEGGTRSYHGKHYTVEKARVYTLPDEPPDVLISGFGPRSTRLAGRIGDGYCHTAPDPEKHLESIRRYVDAGFDEIYVQQIGPEQEGFFRFYEKEILPKLR
jgi:alkanesulfonate monooxygenase SsuD/methylene tetrahydromethanopterin reductase-like flavin-dependent oxidoreductase (luciferase family)